MAIESHTWSTPRTVPWYVVHGEGQVHTVAVVLHGLGQRAGRLAEALAPAAGPGTCLVLPEGLSRSLPRPGAARAGASWSTGEDAELDLADNLRYLGDLADELDRRWPGARKLLVGFSQGGLMLARWLAHAPRPWHRVVLWAAALPRDVDPVAFRAGLGQAELVLAVGDRDPFVTADAVAWVRGRLESAGLQWRAHRFAGAHEIPPEQLAEVLR